MAKVKVAVCGGSGYTGSELLRLLYDHPDVKITAITSERFVNKDISDLFPYLHQYKGLKYQPLIKEKLHNQADVFFMALPHSASQEAVDFFYKKNKKVIDLSADYRLKSKDIYEHWYRVKHNFPSTLKKAIYGLPELYRKPIRKTSLIANPGCYPTSAILALYPAVKHNLIKFNRIVIDSKSGISGAGRKSDVTFSFSEVNRGFRAYNVANHRHTPEIEQELSLLTKKQIKVDFTPHLLPVSRGILSTIYAEFNPDSKIGSEPKAEDILDLFSKTYRNEFFIRILEGGLLPDIRNVCGTNFCEIGVSINMETGTMIIVSAIDNMVKGASGQAIQNMNIMLGIDETTALKTLPVLP